MTPDRALLSYQKSLRIAESQNDAEIIADLRYRIDLMQRFPAYEFDLERLTCCATHGDYFISQIICGEEKINAVIDWTTACVHPVVWEIVRSYVYAAPSCKEGQIDMDKFLRYVAQYQNLRRCVNMICSAWCGCSITKSPCAITMDSIMLLQQTTGIFISIRRCFPRNCSDGWRNMWRH